MLSRSIFFLCLSVSSALTVALTTALALSLTLILSLSGSPAMANPFPLVVLENEQRQATTKSSESSFAQDPDHVARHKVKKGESLHKIMAKYYRGAGLDKKFLQLAIIKANRGAFVRNNPNFLYAGRVLRLPSVNQIKGMVMQSGASGDAQNSGRSATDHIYFMGY